MSHWDESLKIFVNENAQDFVSWIVKGALVKHKLLTEFQVRTIRADALLAVVLEEDGEPCMLVSIELQSTRDPNIGNRLLGYSYEAQREHKLPVLSCVIYLQDVGEVPPSPHEWKLPDEHVYMWFEYISIDLSKLTADEFRQMGLPGLLPMMILTKDGGTHEVLEEIVTKLEAAERRESLVITELLAGLVFTSEEDQRWVERMFAMQRDILADTPAYKRLVKEGFDKGLEQGLEQGLEKGREEGREGVLRQAVVDVVQERFPKIATFAQKQVEDIKDGTLLRRLNVKMSTVQTMQEAIEALITLDNDAKKN